MVNIHAHLAVMHAFKLNLLVSVVLPVSHLVIIRIRTNEDDDDDKVENDTW